VAAGADRSPSALTLRDVVKRYDDVVAVDAVSLDVRAGELVTLLGPSGCGKTTTLRMVAGFVEPDAGEIRIGASDVTRLPPHKRDIGMVFQSYGLFPHMTVEDNVAYGLRMRRVPAAERRRRVEEALGLVQLPGLARRYPRQLSGGQQQRVALARAIVIRPSLLLLDEPLSNLDAKLREEMRWEVRRLQRQLDITTVFVTHDQEEALAISDRIVVMNAGRIEQVGAPSDIYRTPRTLFVARFIGESNLWEGVVGRRQAGGVRFVTAAGLDLLVEDAGGVAEGERAVASVRPEAVAIARAGDAAAARFPNRLEGTVEDVSYVGASTAFRVRIGPELSVLVRRPNAESDAEGGPGAFAPGHPVALGWPSSAGRVIRPA
jgi:putative spermidine/putrescine transport system ATP-binding protein